MFDRRWLKCGFAQNVEENLKARISPITVEKYQ